MLFVKPISEILSKVLMSVCIMLFICGLSACSDDLNPSDSDERPSTMPGTEGNYVGQTAADFTVLDTIESTVVLEDEIALNTGVVLYFTMWCPLCDTHMSSIRTSIKPAFPGVRFLVVDYVSGSIQQSRSAQLSNGYAAETVLADIDHLLLDQFNATMGSTIVIDSLGVIQMNEDYKQSKLSSVLGAL